MKTIELILAPYLEGCRAIYLTGRPLSDYDASETGCVQQIVRNLVRHAFCEHHMLTVRFSLALGAYWDISSLDEKEQDKAKKLVESLQVGLLGASAEAVNYQGPHARALELLRSIHKALRNAKALPSILFLFEFSEDLIPETYTHDNMVEISEIISILANDPRLVEGKSFLILSGAETGVNERVLRELPVVRLPYPKSNDKQQFISALRKSPEFANLEYEGELDDKSAANLAANTPNVGLLQLFRASSRTKTRITGHRLLAQKREDVIRISEGTLRQIDSERVKNVQLIGQNIQRAQSVLATWARNLKEENPRTPVNVLLAGAPSTGKTDLAILLAETAEVPAYEIISAKHRFVGETERLCQVQFNVFKALSPAVGFIDEITDCFPMHRGEENLDSGASSAVFGAMLTALSDKSRAGRSLLVATSNCPWRIGLAMKSRFQFVPIIMPIREDYSSIVRSILGRVDLECAKSLPSNEVQNAAEIFFEKGASPRVIHEMIDGYLGLSGQTIPHGFLMAVAHDTAEQAPADRLAAIYADLMALKSTTMRGFFPWAKDPAQFPYPEYLKGLVESETGHLKLEALEERILEIENKLGGRVNV